MMRWIIRIGAPLACFTLAFTIWALEGPLWAWLSALTFVMGWGVAGVVQVWKRGPTDA